MLAHIERFLQALLLLTHMSASWNELGLQHVFTHCDRRRETSEPDSFKGPLGQSLMTEIHKIKAVQFQPIATRTC